MVIISNVREIVLNHIKPNIKLAIGGGALFLKPMEIIREIIRQKINKLKVYVLLGDLELDLLLGVDAISELHSAYVGIPMVGMANNFRRIFEEKKGVEFFEWTELSMVRAFQGGAIGLPFVALKSLLGSDLVKVRDDFKEISYNGELYVQVPTITPDLAIVHAYVADTNGNVYYPQNHLLDEFSTLPALCSKKLFVTVEKIVSEEEGRKMSKLTMFPYIEVDFIAEAPRGAWPSGFPPFYPSEMGHLMTYSGMSRTPEGFQYYLDEHVFKEEESK